MSTVAEFLADAETRMGKTVESLKTDLGKIRTGRANIDRKSTRLNSSHTDISRMPSSS